MLLNQSRNIVLASTFTARAFNAQHIKLPLNVRKRKVPAAHSISRNTLSCPDFSALK
jgi:hypothetical protein